MTPKNPHKMPLREKILLGTIALVAVWGALWLATPDARSDTPADPAPGPVTVAHCETTDGVTCDPLVWLLGPPPVQPSTATTWEELMLP